MQTIKIPKLCILSTICIFAFHKVLTINNDISSKRHYPTGFCSGDVTCFLWSTNWIFASCLEKLQSLSPCGGEFKYLHRSPESHRGRRKENPVPGVVTGPPYFCISSNLNAQLWKLHRIYQSSFRNIWTLLRLMTFFSQIYFAAFIAQSLRHKSDSTNTFSVCRFTLVRTHDSRVRKVYSCVTERTQCPSL
jgi:hypothetical protein